MPARARGDGRACASARGRLRGEAAGEVAAGRLPAEPPVAPSDPSGVDRGSGVGGASPRSADGCATGERTWRCHPPAERERGASGEPLGAASGAGGEHEHGMRVPRQGRAQPRPRAARPSSRGSRRRHRPVARGRAMHRHPPTPPKPRLRGHSPGLQIDPLPTGRGRETWGNPIHRVSPPPSSGAAAWRGRGGGSARASGARRAPSSCMAVVASSHPGPGATTLDGAGVAAASASASSADHQAPIFTPLPGGLSSPVRPPEGSSLVFI